MFMAGDMFRGFCKTFSRLVLKCSNGTPRDVASKSERRLDRADENGRVHLLRLQCKFCFELGYYGLLSLLLQ